MSRTQASIESMTNEDLARFVVDLFHRIAVHHLSLIHISEPTRPY